MLALRIATGMGRVITRQVNEIRHANSDLPLKRQQLRLFAEYVWHFSRSA